jgi:hypothetical protein
VETAMARKIHKSRTWSEKRCSERMLENDPRFLQRIEQAEKACEKVVE